MKYLRLAYGDEKDWKAPTKEQQESLLVQGDVLRKGGVLMAAVRTTVTTLRAWGGNPITTAQPISVSNPPLAGFSVIEAADVNEVVGLVAGTLCARAKGAIEIRPVIAINHDRP